MTWLQGEIRKVTIGKLHYHSNLNEANHNIHSPTVSQLNISLFQVLITIQVSHFQLSYFRKHLTSTTNGQTPKDLLKLSSIIALLDKKKKIA